MCQICLNNLFFLFHGLYSKVRIQYALCLLIMKSAWFSFWSLQTRSGTFQKCFLLLRTGVCPTSASMFYCCYYGCVSSPETEHCLRTHSSCQYKLRRHHNWISGETTGCPKPVPNTLAGCGQRLRADKVSTEELELFGITIKLYKSLLPQKMSFISSTRQI